MTDINDKALRKVLVERFLDCDTTVAEERELALFYSMCIRNGCVPEGEEDICGLVTATSCGADAADKSGCIAEKAAPLRPRHKLRGWLAAACMAGVIVAGAVVMFVTYGKRQPVLAVADTATVRPVAAGLGSSVADNDVTDGAEIGSAVASVVANAGSVPAKSVSVQRGHDNADRQAGVGSRRQSAGSISSGVAVPSGAVSAADGVDIGSVYNVALAAFRDAVGVTIERKGNAVLLSAADAEGTCIRYVVNETADGQMTLTEL